jgi:hypothetical protein
LDGTYTVDGNSTKDGGGDSSAIGGVFLRAHHRVVVCLEESTNDGEDDDGEDGDDNAVAMLTGRREGRGIRWAHHVQALNADTTGFIVNGGVQSSGRRLAAVLDVWLGGQS